MGDGHSEIEILVGRDKIWDTKVQKNHERIGVEKEKETS